MRIKMTEETMRTKLAKLATKTTLSEPLLTENGTLHSLSADITGNVVSVRDDASVLSAFINADSVKLTTKTTVFTVDGKPINRTLSDTLTGKACSTLLGASK